MCPGCMTAAALQELGPNPAAALFALVARSLVGSGSAQPATGEAAAKERTAANGPVNANQGE